MNKIKLICLPYAGGSSAIYSTWHNHLYHTVNVEKIELSGRGFRSCEPLYETLDDAVNDVYKLIKDSLNEMPYILFGHSMGGLIAYELSQKIKASKLNNPLHIIFSGCNAPHINNKRNHCHFLPDNEFKEVIIKYGATPVEVFENKIMADYFIPIIKSDFKIIETYTHKSNTNKLDCPISIFWGEHDAFVDPITIDEWSKYTNSEYTKYSFPSGHFFINDDRQNVISVINNIISQL